MRGSGSCPARRSRRINDLGYATKIWDRADSSWFLWIAQHGYQRNGGEVFYPLYPLARRRPRPRVRRVLRHRRHRRLARLLRRGIRPLLPARAPATRCGRGAPCAPLSGALSDVALPAGGVQRIALSPLLRRRVHARRAAQLARRRRRHGTRTAHAPGRYRARPADAASRLALPRAAAGTAEPALGAGARGALSALAPAEAPRRLLGVLERGRLGPPSSRAPARSAGFGTAWRRPGSG